MSAVVRSPAAWPGARVLAPVILLALVAAVYAQAAWFGFLEWDDDGYVRDNPHVLGGLTREAFAWALTSFRNANWHPLTWWSLQLDVTLFGQGPRAHHLVNVALHGLNSLLVFGLLARLGLGSGLGPARALAAAAVFAVHPLHVESVAWIAERKDVLCAAFFLGALLAWDRWARDGARRAYALALALFALALMAKPMAVTLPLLLLVLDDWPYGRLRTAGSPLLADAQLRARLVEKLPFFALAAASAVVTYAAQTAGGAVRPIAEVGVGDRLGNAVVAYAMYLAHTLVPTDQSFLHRFVSPSAWSIVASAVPLALVSGWSLARGGAARAGWLWFAVTLLPVIGLVTIGEHARADRYMYLPMIGLLLLAAAQFPATARFGRRASSAGIAAVVAAVVAAVLAFAVAAHRYAGLWRDSRTLFEHALEVDPRNHVAHTLLAATHARLGASGEVFEHAEAALRLAPTTVAAASAAISASNVAMTRGDAALARRYLERAIAAAPGFARPYYNLGTLQLQLGDPQGAVGSFERAILLDPGYSEAYNNLGAAHRSLGRHDQALAAFAEAMRLDPGNRAARANFARAKAERP